MTETLAPETLASETLASETRDPESLATSKFAPEPIVMRKAQEPEARAPVWRRLAWFTPLLALIAIGGLAFSDAQTLYEAPRLEASLTLLLALFPACLIAITFARVFLRNGGPGFVLFGCGALIFAVSSLSLLLAVLAPGQPFDINAIITVHNIAAWGSSLCYLAGAAMLERWRTRVSQRLSRLAAAYACALAAALAIVLMARANEIPLFFIQGQGGSLQRQLILGSAIFALALTTSLLRGSALRAQPAGKPGQNDLSPFFEWFILALLMFAASYVGLMLANVFGGLLSWVGQTCQFVAGIYLLLAALAAYRQPAMPIVIFRLPRGRAPHRYGVTIAVILLAFIARLVFLDQLGGRFPLITFYPAVMVAALYGGFRSGAMASFLATAITDYFLVDPVGSFVVSAGSDQLALAVFFVTNLLLSWLMEKLHQTYELLREDEAARRAELERIVEERTLELRQEVAERRRAEQASTHLASIVASSSDAIVSKSLDGVIASWNAGATRLFGYQAEEIVGQPVSLLVPPELADEEAAVLKRIAAGETIDHYETVRLTRSGARRDVALTASPIRDADGVVVSISKIIRDISDRKRAERAATENRQRIRLATEATGVGIWEWNIFTDQLRWDDQMFRLYGVAPTEDGLVPFETWATAVLPEDLAQERESLRQIVQDGGGASREFRIIRQDNGECRVIEAVDTIRANSLGRAEWVVGTNLDVTERKRAEQALREGEERLRLIGDNLPDSAVFQASYEGRGQLRYLYVSSGIERLNGVRVAAVLKDAYVLLAQIPADFRAKMSHSVQDSLRSLSDFHMEVPMQLPGGATRWMRLQARPRRTPDGRIVWEGVQTDITAARQMRDALQMSQTRFRMAMAIGTTVAFTLDRQRRFTWMNSNQIGVSDESLIGKSMFDIFVEKDAHRLDGLFNTVMERGFGLRRDEEVQNLSRSLPRHLHISAEPLRDETGEIVGLIAAATDVTQRKQTERALAEAKAEAEQASIAKSKFLAAASHDLRQPVQSLTLLLAVIKRQLVDRPKTTEAVHMAESAVKSLNGLLSSILDISKLDAGVVAPAIASVSLDQTVQQLANEYRPRAAASGLSLRCVSRDFRTRTDAALLERILRNLLENALRYTRKGGILIGLRHRGDCVRIDVFDTGIGIPLDKQAAIFEEFRQLDNPARDSSRGLGLGLAIVSRLADLLSIRVEVCSRPEIGSRFSLLLPIDVVRSVLTLEEPQLENPGGRILIIEDNAALRLAFTIMLEDWGYETFSAASGEEAIERAADFNWRLDAILADHRLGPGLTGSETATRIARQAGRAIPTMVVTGDTAKERIADIHASGFAMLHKPVAAEDLRLCLGRLLARAQPATARQEELPASI